MSQDRVPFNNEEMPGKAHLSAEEAVRDDLLDRLSRFEHWIEKTLNDLVILYDRMGKQRAAMNFVEKLIAHSEHAEQKAFYHLRMGQLCEKNQDYERAAAYYRRAFSFEPADNEVWYFINNNLGYSLCRIGKYDEGEKYCRAAIKINPNKYNAYKNLGIIREKQGYFKEAAEYYLKSMHVNVDDPRALGHLEKLVSEHKEVLIELPDIEQQMGKCRNEMIELHLQKEQTDSTEGSLSK